MATTVAPAVAPACSAQSVLSGEALAGTAPNRRAWALVEHPGPWGRDALLDSHWPHDQGRILNQAAIDSGVKVLLARRHRSRPHDGPPRRPFVILTHTGPGGWAVGKRVDLAELEKLPLDDVAAGRRPGGWDDVPPLWAVCTHGTRDTCCARQGRPVASAVALAEPENTWEISHSGGHRFAGVLLALPEGLVYGRVAAAHVPTLIEARANAELVPALLRGRAQLGEPEQAADIALRALTDPGRTTSPVEAITWTGTERLADGTVRTRWSTPDGRALHADVERVPVPAHAPSCGKDPEPGFTWIVRRTGVVGKPAGSGKPSA